MSGLRHLGSRGAGEYRKEKAQMNEIITRLKHVTGAEARATIHACTPDPADLAARFLLSSPTPDTESRTLASRSTKFGQTFSALDKGAVLDLMPPISSLSLLIQRLAATSPNQTYKEP